MTSAAAPAKSGTTSTATASLTGKAQLPVSSIARSLRSVGAGSDGAAFLGEDEHGRPCTVHRVRADVAADPHRRRKLQRRLAFHDQATKEGIRGLLAVRGVALDQNPGVIVIEQTARSLVDEPCLEGSSRGPDFARAVRLLHELARTLSLAHTEGIVHGALSPRSVRVRGPAIASPMAAPPDLSKSADVDDGVALSFLGLRTMPEGQPDALTRLLQPGDMEEPRSVDDAFAFGGLIAFVVLGDAGARAMVDIDPRTAATTALARTDHPLMMLARDLLDPEPAWRPTLADCARRLAALSDTLGATAPAPLQPVALAPDADDDHDNPLRIGRFRLVAELGQGAMGKVYRGIDEDSGAVVAVKLLQKQGPPSPKALLRFRKEARLLAELHNPGIARYLDAGEEGGVLYLVTELVEGQNLSSIVKAKGPFPEREAVAMVVDLLRALVDVHDNGIVHRDLKPENLILVDLSASASSSATTGAGARGTQVKLIDFGVARHFDESESLAMTREGTVLGTPLYMAPEQARGGVVDARSDIYAVGTTLFELLIGRAPFAGKGIAVVLALQLEQVPPKAAELRPDVSDDVSRIIARCLEKDPELRYQDARELLSALLPLVEAPPETVAQHPKTPKGAKPKSSRQSWTFTWDLVSHPSAVWPYVSNTERLSKAIGMGAVNEGVVLDGDDVTRMGRTRQAGFALEWKENPFEWVFERRLGVLREYSEGPMRWYSSTVDLAPHEVQGKTGTRLVHHIELEPRGLLGRAAASVEVGIRTRRALDRTYQRIDDLLQGRLGDAVVKDAFEEIPGLPADKEARMAWLEKQTVAQGADPPTLARLGDWMRQAPAQDVGRIRPIAVARKLGLDENAVINACYHAAGTGLIVPLWDLLCPTCRVPASIQETLKALKDHAHCEACNFDFALDLATSIELVFKLHPSLRDADTHTYCISSPAHTPHVMAQVRLAPNTTFVVDVDLPEGSYQLAGRRLGFSASFRVNEKASSTRWQIKLSKGPGPDDARAFAVGRQELALVNDTGREQLVRIERTTPRGDVLTAARALSSPLFKRLFPGEVLAPGAMVRVAAVTMLLAEVRGRVVDGVSNGEEQSFEKLYALYRAVEHKVVECGGTVVKLQGEGVLAVFDEPAAAVRCAAALPAVLRPLATTATVRCAVHRGAAGAVSLNEHVDYFGRVVHEVLNLAQRAHVGELLLSDAVRGDPAVDAALKTAGILQHTDGTLDDVGHRLQLPETQLSER
ncbi:MAG: protein kinase [Deltaproteobacteria bacterium]|nr:protein kinase [Deltaproteobacteria bacterium]